MISDKKTRFWCKCSEIDFTWLLTAVEKGLNRVFNPHFCSQINSNVIKIKLIVFFFFFSDQSMAEKVLAKTDCGLVWEMCSRYLLHLAHILYTNCKYCSLNTNLLIISFLLYLIQNFYCFTDRRQSISYSSEPLIESIGT